MELCFVRHGIAGEAGSAYPDDRLRPLTAEGTARMREAAAGLATLFRPKVILTSPLVRARQTAAILSEAYPGVPVQETEALAWAALPELCRALNAAGTDAVLAVGHEPHLSAAIGYLVADSERAGILMKKGAAALVACEAAAMGTGELQWLLQPAALRALGRSRTR